MKHCFWGVAMRTHPGVIMEGRLYPRGYFSLQGKIHTWLPFRLELMGKKPGRLWLSAPPRIFWSSPDQFLRLEICPFSHSKDFFTLIFALSVGSQVSSFRLFLWVTKTFFLFLFSLNRKQKPETESCSVALAGLQFRIFLLQPEGWDYSCGLPHSVKIFIMIFFNI